MLPEIVKEWLDKADEDYGFACAGIECTDYFAQICFHFQQAAERNEILWDELNVLSGLSRRTLGEVS